MFRLFAGRKEGARIAGDRTWRAGVTLSVLAALCLIAGTAAVSFGPVHIDIAAVVSNWLRAEPLEGLALRDHIVLVDIRLPRILLGFLVGGALAAAGAMMQGLFRNPLADPGLVGVSSGAAFAAVTMIVLGDGLLAGAIAALSVFAVPVAAILGGLGTTALLYRIATYRGRTSTATMLLAGIAIGALAGALTGILVYVSDDQQLRDLTFWSLGSLGGASWAKIVAMVPFVLPLFVVFPFVARGLNGLLLGEGPAHHIGIDVQTVKRVTILCVALAVGASVAVSGVIGFVGIVVPHLLRLIIGPDHRYLLPSCILLGGSLLLFADTISRLIVAPAELPIGIVTATLGAPFFLWLLLRQRGHYDV